MRRASRHLQAPQIVPRGPQEVPRASRHLQAPQIVPRGICQALRNYKRACAADIIDNDDSWQRVHDSWDWGPVMEEVPSSDDDQLTDSDQDSDDE